jgi:hypothetical protein
LSPLGSRGAPAASVRVPACSPARATIPALPTARQVVDRAASTGAMPTRGPRLELYAAAQASHARCARARRGCPSHPLARLTARATGCSALSGDPAVGAVGRAAMDGDDPASSADGCAHCPTPRLRTPPPRPPQRAEPGLPHWGSLPAARARLNDRPSEALAARMSEPSSPSLAGLALAAALAARPAGAAFPAHTPVPPTLCHTQSARTSCTERAHARACAVDGGGGGAS